MSKISLGESDKEIHQFLTHLHPLLLIVVTLQQVKRGYLMIDIKTLVIQNHRELLQGHHHLQAIEIVVTLHLLCQEKVGMESSLKEVGSHFMVTALQLSSVTSIKLLRLVNIICLRVHDFCFANVTF